MSTKQTMVKLSIGCGMRKPDGWIGLDIRKFKCVDHVLNVGKEKWPLKDNSVDYAESVHLFEHFYPEELFFAMDEAWRVLKPDGVLHIEVPKADTRAFYIHPDHKLHFIEETFGFFAVPDNEGHVDPHGYLKHFWHIKSVFAHPDNPENIHADLIPNKPGGAGYVKVQRYEDV